MGSMTKIKRGWKNDVFKVLSFWGFSIDFIEKIPHIRKSSSKSLMRQIGPRGPFGCLFSFICRVVNCSLHHHLLQYPCSLFIHSTEQGPTLFSQIISKLKNQATKRTCPTHLQPGHHCQKPTYKHQPTFIILQPLFLNLNQCSNFDPSSNSATPKDNPSFSHF